MSVFRVCSWWSAQCSDIDDRYRPEHFLVCKLKFEQNEANCVVVGSHNGTLSIYFPTTAMTKNEGLGGDPPDDLTLEIKLNAPILGVVAGKFLSSPYDKENCAQLAILHPLSLAIYNVTHTPGITYYGSQSAIYLTTEHTLTKCCYSVCKGFFGGVKKREFICILHIDNSLTLFEEDGITYSRTLSGEASILNPIIYNQRSDAFIRVNSTWEVQSFSYQDVAECECNSLVSPTWSITIGEASLQMIPVQITNSRTDILVLGEHSLMSISDAGRLNFVKKLDYIPICFHAFALGWYWEPNARLICAVISVDSRLFIYDNSTLIWVAQLESAPKALLLSNICNLHGALVMLHSKGLIEVLFLGSEPYVFKVHSIDSKAVSYDKISKELLVLERQIEKSINSTDRQVIEPLAEKYIDVNIQTSNELTQCNQDTSRDTKNLPNLTCSLLLSIKVNTCIDELQIMFNSSEGIFCSHKVIMYADLSVRTLYEAKVTFGKLKVQVCSTKLEILISFIRGQGAPRLIKRTCFLPQRLFYEAILQENNSANQMNVSLFFSKYIQLPEFVHIFGEQETNLKPDCHHIMLRDVYNRKIVSILTTKGGLCSKVQAKSIEHLVPVLARLIDFAKPSKSLPKTNLNKNNNNRLDEVLLCRPDISMEEIIKRISSHYEIQQEVKKKTAYMEALWNQFKLFQRSLQAMQDMKGIESINLLMAFTCADLISEESTLLQLQQDSYRAVENLNFIIALIRLILSHSNVKDTILNKLLPAINYPIEDWTNKSWEELSAPSFKRIVSEQSVRHGTKISFETKEYFLNGRFEFNVFAEHIFLALNDLWKLTNSSTPGNFESENSM